MTSQFKHFVFYSIHVKTLYLTIFYGFLSQLARVKTICFFTFFQFWDYGCEVSIRYVCEELSANSDCGLLDTILVPQKEKEKATVVI